MRKFISEFSILLTLCICLVFSSCGTNETGCLSGDNFSGRNTTFDSNIPAGSNGYIDDRGAKDEKNSIVRWQDSGYVSTGEDIILQIKGRWSPWGYGPMNKENLACGSSGNFSVQAEIIEKECSNFQISPLVALNGNVFQGKFIGLENPIGEYPCWLTKGMGFYLLFTNKNINPNQTLNKIQNPDGQTVHLGSLDVDDIGRSKILSADGLYDISGNKTSIQKEMKIYLKILDEYYVDNFGEYEIDFLKGVKKDELSNFFNDVYNWIIKDFFENIKNIFNNIISQTAYKNSIYALLVLYISITSLAFLMGFVKAQLGELSLRLLKIGFVLIMLTPDAWKFFNDNLFKLYFEGVNEIISIVAGSEENFNKDKPFVFLDDIINKFFSQDFWGKRFKSVFYANFLLGTLWGALIGIVLIFMFIMVLYCFCIYILGIVVLGFLTLMLPIVIAFILFNFTKNFFNDWVNLVFSNSFKIIMTFITLIFFANIIELEIQKTLGYKICPANVINANPFSSNNDPYKNSWTILREYAPGETNQFKTMKIHEFIFGIFTMHKRYGFDPVVVKMLTPPIYEETDYRYQSLPFLNPNTKKNPNLLAINQCNLNRTLETCHPDLLFPDDIGFEEHSQIKDMIFNNGTFDFIYFWRIFSMLILCVVLWVIGIHFIESIAEYIAMGGEGIVMKNTDLGFGLKGIHQRYERKIFELTQSDSKIKKYLALGLSAATTTEGFFFRKQLIGSKYFPTIAKLDDLVDRGTSKVLNKFTGGFLENDNIGSRMLGNLVDNFRYFDSGTGQDYKGQYKTTRSGYSLSKQIKEDEINMMGLNRMRDSLGLFLEGVEKTVDNLQNASLFNSLNPLEYSIKSAKLGVSIAKASINQISELAGNGKVFENISLSGIKEDFYKQLFDTKFLGADESKFAEVDKDHRFRAYLDTMDDYYSNLYRQDLADKRKFEENQTTPENSNDGGINVGLGEPIVPSFDDNQNNNLNNFSGLSGNIIDDEQSFSANQSNDQTLSDDSVLRTQSPELVRDIGESSFASEQPFIENDALLTKSSENYYSNKDNFINLEEEKIQDKKSEFESDLELSLSNLENEYNLKFQDVIEDNKISDNNLRENNQIQEERFDDRFEQTLPKAPDNSNFKDIEVLSQQLNAIEQRFENLKSPKLKNESNEQIVDSEITEEKIQERLDKLKSNNYQDIDDLEERLQALTRSGEEQKISEIEKAQKEEEKLDQSFDDYSKQKLKEENFNEFIQSKDEPIQTNESKFNEVIKDQFIQQEKQETKQDQIKEFDEQVKKQEEIIEKSKKFEKALDKESKNQNQQDNFSSKDAKIIKTTKSDQEQKLKLEKQKEPEQSSSNENKKSKKINKENIKQTKEEIEKEKLQEKYINKIKELTKELSENFNLDEKKRLKIQREIEKYTSLLE